MSDSTEDKLKFIISLSVLDDLGINLYGSLPEVIAEAVANSWDADASFVEIETEGEQIAIYDDGIGMTRKELQSFYLTVGHKRREEGRTETPKGRKPMGRKGIGKLSLFSIADVVIVETIKDNERTTIEMDAREIHKKIKNDDGNREYFPEEIEPPDSQFEKGTKITLRDLKKKKLRLPNLRTKLARRFFMIGQKQGFDIKINDESLSIGDRGYSKLVEYLWVLQPYHDATQPYSDDQFDKVMKAVVTEMLSKAEQKEEIKLGQDALDIAGWIGTAKDSGTLSREEANGIVLMVRGKMAHPNILSYLDVRELASKYIFGEIHADFLDDDEGDDIATTDRQRFKEDDERFQKLINFMKKNVIRKVINGQKKFKEESAEKDAVSLLPSLQDYLEKLKGDQRKALKKILGAVNRTELSDNQKREYYKRAIIAQETFGIKGELGKLKTLSDADDIESILDILSSIDMYEAASYYEIAKGRIDVLLELKKITREANKIEAIIRDYLAEHLWLLDPSWDRATEPVETEKTIKKYLNDVAEKLSEKEQEARFDIVYRKASNKHIVVELKRYGRKLTLGTLIDQIDKYSGALHKGLSKVGDGNSNFDIVCLVGPRQDFLDGSKKRDETENTLRPKRASVVTYDEMIDRTLQSYKDILKAEEKKNELVKFLATLSKDEDNNNGLSE